MFLFQFIVVSLKDGMFNNANVLFKTKFVDGVSTVTRYVQHGRTTSVSNNVVDKENNHNTKKKQQMAKRTRLEWRNLEKKKIPPQCSVILTMCRNVVFIYLLSLDSVC